MELGQVLQNGHAYASNKAVIGVIGTFNSGCAEIIIPILNRAPGGPVGMVSPANTCTGLTTPARERPRASRQVLPDRQAGLHPHRGADDFQGAADAMLTKRLGIRRLHPERQGGLRLASPRTPGTPQRTSA